MYKIEKNKPVPEKAVGREKKYPFKDMKVGDCFSIPYSDDKDARRKQSNVLSQGRYYRPGVFTARKITEEKVVRVWKIK